MARKTAAVTTRLPTWSTSSGCASEGRTRHRRYGPASSASSIRPFWWVKRLTNLVTGRPAPAPSHMADSDPESDDANVSTREAAFRGLAIARAAVPCSTFSRSCAHQMPSNTATRKGHVSCNRRTLCTRVRGAAAVRARPRRRRAAIAGAPRAAAAAVAAMVIAMACRRR